MDVHKKEIEEKREKLLKLRQEKQSLKLNQPSSSINIKEELSHFLTSIIKHKELHHNPVLTDSSRSSSKPILKFTPICEILNEQASNQNLPSKEHPQLTLSSLCTGLEVSNKYPSVHKNGDFPDATVQFTNVEGSSKCDAKVSDMTTSDESELGRTGRFLQSSSNVLERPLCGDTKKLIRDYKENRFQSVESLPSTDKNKLILRSTLHDKTITSDKSINSLAYSTFYDELLLASYSNLVGGQRSDGLLLVWNQRWKNYPELILRAHSEVTVCKFSPSNPNIVAGGGYNGQLFLWDMRQGTYPALSTNIITGGHIEPISDLNFLDSFSTDNIVTCSTDGYMHLWDSHTLAKPTVTVPLMADACKPMQAFAPTCLSYTSSDLNAFMIGAEDGRLRIGKQQDLFEPQTTLNSFKSLEGHSAYVTGLDVMRSNIGVEPLKKSENYLLSSSLDWTVKLWSSQKYNNVKQLALDHEDYQNPITCVREFDHQDMVFDVKWNPVRSGCFASVDAVGSLSIWDLKQNLQTPIVSDTPSKRKTLNRVVWQPKDDRHLACGGLGGSVYIYESNL
ncbi:dynein intermediate chain Dic1 [Schizosaccharomyces cryophilus OY26]|uniref:Dynein intermediate chain Dic1 n=1 Tax=Schizosaccharomyces cryophilus (strain OY26 / ATCC MYA-4695 / CBS 11777 / NBRC 106824 / NRRL Y48691) TaxID=653667 RepID=S9W8T3_SCHCR|nr:dynein intermediate chain Dic1 [Schizosaccharomyces cryophilus OY26]EPY54305.1 dynein intermediate chain Dic1 [Schizosaccharomyces cryophilus OY26]